MEQNEKFNKLVNMAHSDTERAAEIIAKSFYKILRKSGFSDDQVISVASNILDCLLQTLDGYKEASEKRVRPHAGIGVLT